MKRAQSELLAANIYHFYENNGNYKINKTVNHFVQEGYNNYTARRILKRFIERNTSAFSIKHQPSNFKNQRHNRSGSTRIFHKSKHFSEARSETIEYFTFNCYKELKEKTVGYLRTQRRLLNTIKLTKLELKLGAVMFYIAREAAQV